MRTIRETKYRFEGTHKGCSIDIQWDGDEDEGDGCAGWYIRVRTEKGCGGYLYDGWAPSSVCTMAEAKAEAIRGSCLDRPKPPRKPKMLHGLPVSP